MLNPDPNPNWIGGESTPTMTMPQSPATPTIDQPYGAKRASRTRKLSAPRTQAVPVPSCPEPGGGQPGLPPGRKSDPSPVVGCLTTLAKRRSPSCWVEKEASKTGAAQIRVRFA